jgi:menaquinone-dependent protoporphyrinogen oxidase
MPLVGILYATREGQTRRISEYIAVRLRSLGIGVELRNIREDVPQINLSNYSGVIVAASVHVGKHEIEMIDFVKAHLGDLDRLPAAFVSVTLSQAGAQRADATVEEHARFTADVQKMLEDFFAETGWRPKRVNPVAGALQYSKYSWLVRFVMKRIAKQAGAETDTSRDYEYTDWRALDDFTDEFANECRHAAATGQCA